MKDYEDVVIFCRCSARMHTRGKHFRQYENSPHERKCPNCGKIRRTMVRVRQAVEDYREHRCKRKVKNGSD